MSTVWKNIRAVDVLLSILFLPVYDGRPTAPAETLRMRGIMRTKCEICNYVLWLQEFKFFPKSVVVILVCLNCGKKYRISLRR
jgi:hypothetical protein